MESEAMPRKIGAGALQAAGRQGVKELGEALKAFPDSISVSEPGGIFSPTQGEIAEVNREGVLWGRLQEARSRADTESRSSERDEGPNRD
jgi:hypothetical protein